MLKPETRYWQGMIVCLASSAGAALWLALLASWTSWPEHIALRTLAIGTGVIVATGALWFAMALVRGHRRDIQRLRGSLLLAGGEGHRFLDHADRMVTNRELKALAGTVDSVLASREDQRQLTEQRLTGILAALPTGVVVVTPTGLVSLVNNAARHIFPADALSPGTSVFAAITRESVPETDTPEPVASVRSVDGRDIPARIAALGDRGGWVMILEAPPGDGGGHELDHDLALHDTLPPAPPPEDTTPLAVLPGIVVDCETTGLDPRRDRIVSIGAVRTHGVRIYAHANLDMLIDPAIAIPRPSTAIHGIDNAMVQGAPEIGAGLGSLEEISGNCVVIGHNIGFDLAILAAESRRCGRAWPMPFSLDTGHLVAVLEPDLRTLDLDAVCRHFGGGRRGRPPANGGAHKAGAHKTPHVAQHKGHG
ncbi:MAG: exonuclease domain-containing protein, partial [bacterium]|nr:exonuclease domain-containing protein [bacterium]